MIFPGIFGEPAFECGVVGTDLNYAGIYAPLINTLENSEENTTTLLHYEPTGWDLVDDGVNRMKEVLISAEKTLDYQSVGMYGRELLITLA